MTNSAPQENDVFTGLENDLNALANARDNWARTPVSERIQILQEIKDALLSASDGWVRDAARAKGLSADSPLAGEEWLSGPYAVMSGCNGLMQTLSELEGKAFLRHIPFRTLPSGQTAARVTPHGIWDRLLLSGVKADVWMKPGVNEGNIAEHAATAYDVPPEQRTGRVALVLGAGNIAAIAPLDAFQKLFLEHQVVVLKMNPVNDYLTEHLEAALRPLIERDALRIVKGGGDVGAWLTEHPTVEEIHITGAESTHDAIIWGRGDEGQRNREAGTPRLDKRITSELGAVCPTIVVPGNWSGADIRFQAEQIATQKLHNSGFNCVACQALLMPEGWDQANELLNEIRGVMGRSTRPAYYPGAEDRLETFRQKSAEVTSVSRDTAPDLLINQLEDDDWFRSNEIFAPALSTHSLEAPDAEQYLRNAIDFANSKLHGTLGANIVIHPDTIRSIGRDRFEALLTDLRYGTIAINTWTGLGFLNTACPWGAFPGHTLDDVQSGIGTVHNTFMFDAVERAVVEAPFRPFPRSVLSGEWSLLPRPPWFITNRRQHRLGRLLTRFQHSPGWHRIPRIFANALLG
ncbi:aldehyde dehydrogenase family protein [Marinobacter sp. M1N3S26]|uniref:aldehyde dehydrogenase family protein n=1 Tax=Marinobacter sp. M1N3S26 TaxID=3382299 RepID=UPI00387AFDF1